MRILILGAGAWGTALAQHAAQRNEVLLHARDASLAALIRQERTNRRYLPDVVLHRSIEVGSDMGAALDWLNEASDGLVVVATSMAGLRPTLLALRDQTLARNPAAARSGAAAGHAANADAKTPSLIWLCKGIEQGSGLLAHEVAREVLPDWRTGVLTGPSFAQEVAAGLPVALVVAGTDRALADQVVAALHFGAARIYQSDDLIGLELGGALKNVMAIATGICDGLALGANARAALITRGLAEMSRMGVAAGARAETFMGLAGLGDLVLTCTGELSRNRRVGLGLAAGQSLPQVLAALGHVAEGVATVRAALEMGARLGIELPIVQAVSLVLEGLRSPRQAVGELLAREPKREH